MFSNLSDFYPTPPEVIDILLEGLELNAKRVLEPSGGKGDLVDAIKLRGADVISCEIDKDLLKILQTKCVIIGEDFLKIESHQVSHIDAIIMNPPFSAGAEHIIHAWNIAPPGCTLRALDRVTAHHSDNRFNIEGWKTNSHFLLTRRFIMPRLTEIGWSGQVSSYYGGNHDLVGDLLKALCYITGDNYDDFRTLESVIRSPFALVKDGKFIRSSISLVSASTLTEIKEKQKKYPGSNVHGELIRWGKWFEWGYFKIRCYKKGTVHFEFKDEKVWALFNQRIAKLKGYPLPEKRNQTKYQERQTGRKPVEPMIIETIEF